MEGNVVKAAWILGGSIVLSFLLLGVGLVVAGTAILQAQRNTHVEVRGADSLPIKVGFEPKMPVNVRIENAWDDGQQKRAPLELEVNPELKKK